MTKHLGLHKYIKVNLGSNRSWPVYKCIVPGCRHYLHRDTMVGVSFSCFVCDETETITKSSDLISKLKCKNCRDKTSKVSDDEVIELLERLKE